MCFKTDNVITKIGFMHFSKEKSIKFFSYKGMIKLSDYTLLFKIEMSPKKLLFDKKKVKKLGLPQRSL